jgi:hypothetical protein
VDVDVVAEADSHSSSVEDPEENDGILRGESGGKRVGARVRGEELEAGIGVSDLGVPRGRVCTGRSLGTALRGVGGVGSNSVDADCNDDRVRRVIGERDGDGEGGYARVRCWEKVKNCPARS